MLHETGQRHAMAQREVADTGRPMGKLRDHRATGAIRQAMTRERGVGAANDFGGQRKR